MDADSLKRSLRTFFNQTTTVFNIYGLYLCTYIDDSNSILLFLIFFN